MLNTFYVDELRYVIQGEDFHINDFIVIHNPTVREVSEYGEFKFAQLLNLLTRRPYDVAVELDDIKLNYQKLTDWDLFVDDPLDDGIRHVPKENTSIFFGNIDFTNMIPITSEDGTKRLVLSDNPMVVIDQSIFTYITKYLRHLYFIDEKVEFDAGNEQMRRALLDKMRRKQKKLVRDYQNGKVKMQSNLSNMIHYCCNHSEFCYNYAEVMDIKLGLLYASYYYIQYSNEREHIVDGMYHGTIDVGKMKDKSVLNAVPDLHK